MFASSPRGQCVVGWGAAKEEGLDASSLLLRRVPVGQRVENKRPSTVISTLTSCHDDCSRILECPGPRVSVGSEEKEGRGRGREESGRYWIFSMGQIISYQSELFWCFQ